MVDNDNNSNFEEIYLTYFSRMKSFAREYVLSDTEAESIVQDIFLELWERKELLSMNINLIAYLFTAIKNRCIDFLRRQLLSIKAAEKLQEEYLLTMKMNCYSLEVLDENIFSENHLEDIISKAIDSLPERCREIFIMRKIEGKNQKDIAEALSISINTVETQMGIAYKKLKIELKDYFPILLFLLYL